MRDWIHSIFERVTGTIRSAIERVKGFLGSAVSRVRDVVVAITRATGD